MMKPYIILIPFLLNCTSFTKKETPVEKPTVIEQPKEYASPMVERITIMIGSFSKNENSISLEPIKQTDRKKLEFFIERLENDQYLKLDFQIIPIKNITRYKAEVVTKKYGKNNIVLETSKFILSTSDKDEFIEQLKNIVK